jgi:hypothetical protein
MKKQSLLLVFTAVILTVLTLFFFLAPKQSELSRIEIKNKSSAWRGDVELQVPSLREAVIRSTKTEQSRVIALASRPLLETIILQKISGFSIVGSGDKTQIVNANNEVVFRPGFGRSLGGLEINTTGSLAKLSFGESPFVEIVSLPSFDKITEIGIQKISSDIGWRWLSDRMLIGIRNSSGGDAHNELGNDRESELYVFNIDLDRVEGPMVMPPNSPLQFEVAEVLPNGVVQLLAQEKENVRELWVIIKP